MKAVLIDGPSQKLYELDMKPSHLSMEEEIGTRFWVMRRLAGLHHGCVLFHAEGRNKGYEDFTFLGIGYSGSGLVCSIDVYGDLGSSVLSADEIAEYLTWGEHGRR